MSDPTPKNIFEDFARMANSSSAGIMGGARDAMIAAQQEFQTFMQSNFEKIAAEMKLARSDDLETVKAMVVTAREAQEQILKQHEDLMTRLTALEKTLADSKKGK
ncbi:MAG: hypothetical protein QM523_03955 [Candidatus Pacebacteria bacterium]|nr:hypothetical protein [Candidatus Paceibacterota bacterium]